LQDQSKQYERKAAQGIVEESSSANENSKESSDEKDDDDETDQFAKILANDMNFPSSAIKIIKAPDLSKDSESKSIAETLTKMLESQELIIQKYEEELEEMNEQSADVPEKERTADEVEGK